jgi:CRISPR-associated protein Cas2
MARRRYLVSYDIRDEKRLRAVAKCAEAFGERIQYSLFICDLDGMELVEMQGQLHALIAHHEDSLLIVHLGDAGDTSRLRTMGQPLRYPSTGARIV